MSEPQFATFWRRTGAHFIDLLVIIPLAAAVILLQTQKGIPVFVLILTSALNWLIGAWYNIGLHAKFGQTLGKMATKIKVVNIDFSPIGLKQASLRHSVEFGLSGLSVVLTAWGLFLMPQEQIETLGFFDRSTEIAKLVPALNPVIWVLTAWAYSELLIMLTNKRRRAIHDFIAGTVVIRTPLKGPSSADGQSLAAMTSVP